MQPLRVQAAQVFHVDRAHLVDARRLHRVRVLAVHPFEQRDPGQVRGLAQRHLYPVDQAIPLGDHLVHRICGVVQHLGEEFEQPVQPGRQGVAADEQPIRVDARAERATDGL